MSKELILDENSKAALREYTDRAPGNGEVKIKTTFGAPKHGTEM
jgi:hypothetical protein